MIESNWPIFFYDWRVTYIIRRVKIKKNDLKKAMIEGSWPIFFNIRGRLGEQWTVTYIMRCL